MNLADRFTSTSFRNQLIWLVIASIFISAILFFVLKKLCTFEYGFTIFMQRACVDIYSLVLFQ
jgi:hypothetical protein